MHDIHPNSMVGDGGGVGRFFGGGIGGGGGDRRLRAHQNQHQALKCPRCNSLNTKFCYYNNYNLSQPRHFCKSCRRYWTKGGVLRNVPVGGGCRKTKRSKPKHSSTAGKPTPDATDVDAEGKSTASHSSSESSSLTASNSAVAASASVAVVRPGPASAAEVLSVPISDFSMNNPRLYGNAIEWPALVGQGSSDGGIFTEMGSFTSLISTPSNETTPFGLGGNTVNPNQQCLDHQKVDGERVNQQFNDQTVQGDGFGPLDWGGGGDHVLYDLTSTVDHAYWSQSQWTTDPDHHGLYLP